MERPGATTMKGNPLTLIGPELQNGDHAPDFTVVDGTLSPVNLEKTGSNVRIISVVPSLDTPVCDRSEERRVGKECRSVWWRDQLKREQEGTSGEISSRR